MSTLGSEQLPEELMEELSPMDDQSMMMEEELPPRIPPEQANLAEDIDEEELKKIAIKAIEDYETDVESRAEWEERHAEWLRLYYGTHTTNDGPWSGSSQESMPILTEAINQFQSRSYKAFFPSRYFIDCIPVGQSNPEARERAERIGKHMSYQLGVLDRTYKLNKSQMFLAAALHGSDFTKTYFSPIKRRTIIERVRALDLVVPYGVGPRNIEDVERKTHVKQMSLNETRILKSLGWFIDEGTPSGLKIDNSSATTTAIDAAEGLSDPAESKSNSESCTILEQHTILDLDEDGIAEPYILWIDLESKKVLRLQIRYEVDDDGIPTKDKEPIEYFTHYQFLPNPDGFYGLGFGHLIGDTNKAVNKLLRMFIDANELSVVGNNTFVASDKLGLPGDVFEVSLGKTIKVPGSIENIGSQFTQLNFRPPSQETLQMIQELQARASKISANSDILSGQPDKVYQPQAMLAMIEQGLQLFSSVQEFLGYSMEDELQKVYRLNAKYLQEDQYFVDGDQQIEVTREDYSDDFRVVPIFDPKYATRSQKLAKAQAAWEFAMSNPLMANDPNSLYLVSRDYLEALDIENIDEVLPPPPQKQPLRIDSQTLENAYYLMPPEKRPLFDVFPDQDHVKHIQEIDKVLEWVDQAHPLDVPNPPMGDPQISKLITTLSNDQKQELIANLLNHRKLHVAFMFGQLNGVMDEQGNPIGAGGTSGMAAQTNDTAGLQAIMSALQSLPIPDDMPN